MLIVTNLSGQTEALTDYKSLERKRRVNGERSLSFFVPKTPRNEHAFDLVQEESVVEYDGHEYRIKQIEERLIGNTPVKQVHAEHVFFDIIDVYQYGTISGTKSINETLSFTLNGTGYTFSVIDSFNSVQFENFGDDTALALFQKILERYQAEFDIVGTDVRIYKQIGSQTDFQFRYKHNIKTFAKTVKTDNLSTYIKGYGKQNDDGTYQAVAEYTSPMADIYGIRHAKPIKDERFTDSASLLDYIKTQIQDTPEISITIEFTDLAKAGYPYSSPNLGDTVYLIYEPLNVDMTTRILEIIDYPESNQSPKVTLANFNEDFADVMFRHTKSQIEKIYDENTGKVRFNVLDEAVRIATEAINNSRTELQYPPSGGIRAVDPNDPNRFVAFTSAGIGVTTDGGATFPQAITADGINTQLLIAGQIKTNHIQIVGEDNLFFWDGTKLIAIDPVDANKYVQLNSAGLYVKKGHVTVEREDGYPIIIGGQLNHEFNLGTPDPPWTDAGVQIYNTYWRTQSSSNYVTCQAYFFKHSARYLQFDFAAFTEPGGTVYVRVVDSLTNPTTLAYYETTLTESEIGGGTNFVIDLGVPTGNLKVVFLQLKSQFSNTYVYLRTTRQFLKG
ncbi:phage tail protein [Bacillus alveayuensis]|uniref:phage tail protein n=1 Tax=Aeribacillus alveayuensis TaxID=279215 RepID=UPI0006980D57|nr:phage tail protein [Bacillus alveayuensis]